MKNETSSVYGTIYQIAIAIFIFVLVELYTIKESNDVIFFKDTSADFILSVVTSGIVFYVILELTKWTYVKWWIRKYPDLYLAGDWLHIHGKNSDLSYLRVGIVRIKQNFYDLEVHAENYSPKYGEDGIFRPKNRRYTRWKYLISEVNDAGDVVGVYRASRKYTEWRTNEGIHKLSVIEVDDEMQYPTVLAGEYADIYPSDSEGYLRLYRVSIGPGKKKMLPCLDENGYPEVWKTEVLAIMEDARLMQQDDLSGGENQ